LNTDPEDAARHARDEVGYVLTALAVVVPTGEPATSRGV